VKQKSPMVRYPGYDVLEQRGHWDEATRQVVLDRMHNIPTIKYFTLTEVEILQAVCDRVMPQDDRPKDQRIAIVPWIDQRCHFHLSDGTRFEEMPPDEIAWRWGLEGIDQTSWAMHGRHFVELEGEEQDSVLERIRQGDPPGEVWQRMPASRFWTAILMRHIVGPYYAHPWAWNEIGFGGPAYPRGYASLNANRREPWEVDPVRVADEE
jgi:hypothetical protein